MKNVHPNLFISENGVSIEPFSQPPPPVFGGSIDPPPPREVKTRHAKWGTCQILTGQLLPLLAGGCFLTRFYLDVFIVVSQWLCCGSCFGCPIAMAGKTPHTVGCAWPHLHIIIHLHIAVVQHPLGTPSAGNPCGQCTCSALLSPKGSIAMNATFTCGDFRKWNALEELHKAYAWRIQRSAGPALRFPGPSWCPT